MVVQLLIELFVILIGIYYFTIFLHLMGVRIFKKTNLFFGKAFIPFYYWFNSNTTI